MNWIQTHIPPWVFIAIVVHLVVMGTVAYLILLERKVASWVQDRIGPNRVGLGFGIIPFLKDKKMFGLGQPLADGMKFLFKEDYRPAGVDKILFTVAPIIMIIVVIISIAVIPWGGVKQTTRTIPPGQIAADVVPNGSTIVASSADAVTYQYPFQIASVDIGVLYILAILSLGVYGIVIGGWASNNKYSFLGGLRATANMISYEIPLGLCVLCIVLMFGTLDLSQIVVVQTGYWLGFIPKWNVFVQPIAFLLFLVCIHAEANRAPFDLAEAEQELVGGYHTEYSSMRFAMFFLGEYAGMITTSCVLVALFFGGWHLPWLEWIPFLSQTPPGADKSVTTSLFVCILRAFVLFGKAGIVLFVFMWVRWSLPRFRFDQLMNVAWRGLIPITLALVAATTVLVYLTGGRTMDGVSGRDAIVFIVMNIAVVFGIFAAAMLLPAPLDTNRKIHVAGSRYATTPLPAGVAS
ncbi:MAG: NADH-quinone oxidoreductase subunit NuoH [Anaerolineae bacterium]|nr:NADH-quinone oxidoreductase subunit NuoH [Phycisphaerae bacterium]